MAEPFAQVRLTEQDHFALARVVRGGGGFQDLLNTLRGDWERAGRGQWLPIRDAATAEKVRRYATEYGQGGWQNRLTRWVDQLPPATKEPSQQGLL